MKDALTSLDVVELDGIVLDIGVSSMQIDQPERGFSFRYDGPLDMRMGMNGTSAAEIVNQWPEEQLADVIFRYGEERFSRKIARTIVEQRAVAPIERTSQLRDAIVRALPAHAKRPGTIDPATRTFQALRIAVNDELGELQAALDASLSLLKTGGRMVVVSFHSLEDRIVKQFIQRESGKDQSVSRYLPVLDAPRARVRPVTRGAVLASDAEAKTNPRARSAKLRAFERLPAAMEASHVA